MRRAQWPDTKTGYIISGGQWRGSARYYIIIIIVCVLLRGGSDDRERIIVVIDTARIAGDPRESRRGVIVRAASL